MRFSNNMPEFSNQRKMRHVFYSRTLTGILLVFLVFAVNAAWGAYAKYTETKTNKDEAVTAQRRLQEREEAIQKEIARLETDRGKEEEIRNQFGFARSGEGVIVIVEPRENDLSNSPSATGSVLGNAWGSIKSIFSRN